MTATLEDRLAGLGEQLDRLIDAEPLPQRPAVSLTTSVRPSRSPRRTLVVLLTAACVLSVAVWAATRSTHRTRTVPATVVSEPVPAATDAAPTVAPPPLAIGTSVMLGAIDALQAGGFRGIAEVSAQAADQIETLRRLEAAGDIGDVVVVEAGVNGPVSAEQYDEMAQLLADVPTVVFLTVHAEVAWAEPNNDLVWSLPARYPNVTVLDWDGLVDFGNIPGMADDGIHLGTTAARQAYANFVFDAIGRPELAQPLDGYRSMEDLDELLPPLPTFEADSDPVGPLQLTAPGIDVSVTTQGSMVCATSHDGISSGSACTDGRPTGMLALIVGSPSMFRPSEFAFVHRADVEVVGDGRCVIATAAAASGLAVSACDVGEFVGVVHVTFTLPDGTSALVSPFGTASNSGLPSAFGFTKPVLERLARHLPPMRPVDGSWVPVPFLDGTVAVSSTRDRPCVEYLVGSTTLHGCPVDGQRTGLVSVVDRAGTTDSNTVVLLHDASVTVTAVEGCTIERLDVAETGLALSGCTTAASVTQVVLDLAHDGRVDRVVVPFDR